MDHIKEIQRWDDLRKAAIEHGLYATMERNKIVIHPSMSKISSLTAGTASLHSIEEFSAWLDGYVWMASYAKNLGWNLREAENQAREELDRQRILRTLSSD